MFDPVPGPRVFGVAPGANFPEALAHGLWTRLRDMPPESMARVEVIVNTARVQSRTRSALMAKGAGFLPRIRLITDLVQGGPAESPLRTRLGLAQAIRVLLQQEPDLAPPAAAFSLADSLYRLLDEMQGEGVDLAVLQSLDVSNHSEHWTRSLTFIRLISDFFGAISGGQGRLLNAVQEHIARWAIAPPTHPVIIAGSTGSRGPSALLMRAVSGLPQGALVLPGYDFAMPASVWTGLEDPLDNEDHPQFRYARLMRAIDLDAGRVATWSDLGAPDPARNALVSLALRPAPVTDQWLRDGPALGDLIEPTRALSLIEANSPRQEALSIALCLRDAVVKGKKAALITPDRTLARRVTAVLDRWQLRPDDSAGRPLALSAPGRFMRQCAELMGGLVSAEALIALLKNPIAHSATDRGQHLRHLRELELHLRKRAIPYPDATILSAWAARDDDRKKWADWLIASLIVREGAATRDLQDWLTVHVSLAHQIAAGAAGTDDTGELWKAEAGNQMQSLISELSHNASFGGAMQIGEYSALLDTILVGKEVRETAQPHGSVMIWGTLEARALGADLIVLGGLVEGTWPAAPQPDPWFNRQMRLAAGLLLPERQIGLSAHDFQQCVGAAEVVLARAQRTSEAETVPSRWLNRLINLISGLSQQSGPQALDAMRARGQVWVSQALRFEADLSAVPQEASARNPRPAPAPPVSTRPRALSVTRIEKLVRDPYAIYAEHILKLRRLDPLAPVADARVRGTVLHKVLDLYVRAHPPGTRGDVQAFLAIAETILEQECPWHTVRLHWLARLRQTAGSFVSWNAAREATLVVSEEKASLTLRDPPFVLTGQPDRIDRMADGSICLFDYKTGAVPTTQQQNHFNKQLLLLAIMAEDAAFSGLGPATVLSAAYVGLGAECKEVAADVSPGNLTKHRAELAKILNAYFDPSQGYTAMRSVEREERIDDYHPLARRGEWLPSDPSETICVGDADG